MASKEPHVHRLDLGRIVVEGDRQPIVRVATLTLKDEDPDKHIMQVHVDGRTLAQWDLGTLSERKSTGGEQFFSISEQNMLHFTLPLSQEAGETTVRGTELKTIQIFLRNPEDFPTAVHYLCQNAGLRHCQLKNVSANLMDTNAPQHAQSQSQESSSGSIMEPPMRPPIRPRSQSSVFVPAGQGPAQFIRRPQTARPDSTLVNMDSTQHPPRPTTAGPIRGQIPPQGHRYRSSLPQRPQKSQGFFPPDGFIRPQQFPSRGPGLGGAGDMMPLYDRPMRGVSMASHGPTFRLMQYNVPELLSSHQQVQADTRRVLGGVYHDHFDGQSANGMDQAMFPASRTINMGAPLFEQHSSSQPVPEEFASRSLSVSERGAPIKIQVLGPPDEPNHSHSGPKILWEFTLHLLPTTKIFELCLLAASYIRSEYRVTVDGRALAAQSRNGTAFDDQDSLSQGVLHGEALFLIERRLLGTVYPVPINLSGSYSNTSHPGWRSEEGKLHGSRPASCEDSSSQVIDETDQVPPPRRLPSPLVAALDLPRSSSSTILAQSPLSERPDLMNTGIRTRANSQAGQATSPNVHTKSTTKKPPRSHQNRPPSTSSRPASLATGSKLDSMSAPSKLRALTKRPETSLGIRSKRKAPSTDAAVSAAIPSVKDSVPSDAESRKSEQATAACVGCKNKKRKCDRAKPACGPCVKDDRPCTYPNIREKAVTDSTARKEHKAPTLEHVNYPMALRSQAATPHPPMSDTLTQTSHAWESRDTGMQTQFIEQPRQDVDMKDMGTNPLNLYTDASTETDKCNDTWLPFSQCAEVVLWGYRRYEEQVEKAAEIFRTTDPFDEDYLSKVSQAASYAVEFEEELRDKYEEILR